MNRAGGAVLICLALAFACDDPAPPRRPQGISEGEARSRSGLLPKAAPAEPAAPRSQLTSPFQEQRATPGADRAPTWGGSGSGSAGTGTGATGSGSSGADAVAAPGTGGVAAASAGDAGGPVRDLASELRALLEPVGSCLDAAAVAAAGGRLAVTVVAYLVSSGRVSRVSASAPGQPNEALRCLEARVSRGGLRGPIPGAPLQVTVTVPIEVIPAPANR